MLDREIDDVARAMTEAPADPAFAGRVSMRIAETSGGPKRAAPRPPTLWSRPWVLVPIAAACALVLAVFIARDNSVPPTVGRPFQGRQGGAESPAPHDIVTERVAPRDPQVRPLPELPPTTIAPIRIDRLVVQPIAQVSEIDISPIGIERIEISAMP